MKREGSFNIHFLCQKQATLTWLFKLIGGILFPTRVLIDFVSGLAAGVFCLRASSCIASVGATYHRFFSYFCDMKSRILFSSFESGSRCDLESYKPNHTF